MENWITKALDLSHPYWWERPPKNALPFSLKSKIDITEQAPGLEIPLIESAVKDGHVAVMFYSLQSYTTILAITQTVEDHPGVITGRIAWYPTADAKPALQISSNYPQTSGYIGAPGTFVNKHTGFSECLPLSAPRPLPVILGPGRKFGLMIQILDPACGDAIPVGERRYVSASCYGWQIPIPPNYAIPAPLPR